MRWLRQQSDYIAESRSPAAPEAKPAEQCNTFVERWDAHLCSDCGLRASQHAYIRARLASPPVPTIGEAALISPATAHDQGLERAVEILRAEALKRGRYEYDPATRALLDTSALILQARKSRTTGGLPYVVEEEAAPSINPPRPVTAGFQVQEFGPEECVLPADHRGECIFSPGTTTVLAPYARCLAKAGGVA